MDGDAYSNNNNNNNKTTLLTRLSKIAEGEALY